MIALLIGILVQVLLIDNRMPQDYGSLNIQIRLERMSLHTLAIMTLFFFSQKFEAWLKT
jgi:hypothetical protein